MSCVRSRVVALMIVISYVAGVITEKSENKSENTLKFLPASKEFLARLAEDVCYDIINPANLGNDVEVDNCIKKFLRPSKNKNVPPPSKFSLMCRSKDLAMYSVAPSENRLLVVLLNDNIYAIPTYNIMNVLEETGTIVIQPNYNYTFWITTLTSDGTPTIWYRGPHVPPWREDQKETVIVKINEPHIVYKNNLKVDAVFEIQFFGEHSLCSPDMEVVNKCKKMVPGDFFQAVISPNQNRSLEIANLPIDDDCTLKVEGNGAYLKKKYRTSLSDAHVKGNKTLEEREFEPEIAQDVSLEAIETGEGWNIHVNWKRPIHDPDTYNLTLRAPGVFENVVVAGVSTEYTFQNVSGETMAIYNVSVAAINKIATATTVRRAQFPQRSSYQATIVYGSCIALLTVAVLALGAIVWRRRRHARLAKLSYISAPHTKPFKERNRKMEECLVGGMEDCWEVRSERLLLHEVIGEGAFGVVRKGTLAPNGKEVAVKMLKDFPTVEEIRSFRAEMELMKSVGAHPHVVSLVGCCSGRRPLIVAEYCSRGDLLSFLRCSWDVMVSKRNAKYYNNNIESSDYRNDLFKKPKDSKLSQLVVNKLYDLQGICDSELTSLDLLSFCRQIAMGMEFLASNRVVHRDLAARNILVTGDRTLKIADFGLSRDVYQENQYKQKGNGKMPVKWMALESLTHRIYTTQSDVWSFGVVIWEVVTVGGSPYPGVPAARLPRLLRAGYRMPKPNNCSKPLYELMLSCWRARPRDRPNFTELHRQLDELLNSACADDYLSLELDDDAPPTPKPQRYLKMLLRGNRVWARGEIYERPLKGPSNHYTSPPAPQAKPQAV